VKLSKTFAVRGIRPPESAAEAVGATRSEGVAPPAAGCRGPAEVRAGWWGVILLARRMVRGLIQSQVRILALSLCRKQNFILPQTKISEGGKCEVPLKPAVRAPARFRVTFRTKMRGPCPPDMCLCFGGTGEGGGGPAGGGGGGAPPQGGVPVAATAATAAAAAVAGAADAHLVPELPLPGVRPRGVPGVVVPRASPGPFMVRRHEDPMMIFFCEPRAVRGRCATPH